MKKKTWLSSAPLLLILVIGVSIRIGGFPHIPPGFNQDEAASAYESFSLAETGMDKWGNAWPAYFPAWGSGQNVLLAYLTLPFVKAFGLNIFTARLVSLLLGLLTLPLFFFGLRPLGRFPALFGTFLLAVVPWHFLLSHWGLESNLVPFFMLLGCVALSRALITRQQRWIIPSLVPFALSLYAYGTTIIVLPFLLGGILLLGYKQIWAQRGIWLVALALFVVVAAPFLLFFLENYILSRNLAWTDSLFFSTPLLPSTRMSQVADTPWTGIVAKNWRFLVSGFNDGTCYNRIPGFKPLLYPTLPLAIVGLLLGARKAVQARSQILSTPRTTVLATFALWGLASLPLFFAFELNINRFNHFYLPCIVLAVWAFELASRPFSRPWAKRAVSITIIGWIAVESSLAINRYFTVYPSGPIKADFNAGLEDAFDAVKALPNVDQVLITEKIPLPYVYTLFYLRYPPAQFQREVDFNIENGIYKVKRFGKYVFSDGELHHDRAYGYLFRKGEFGDSTLSQKRRRILFTNEAWEVGVMPENAD